MRFNEFVETDKETFIEMFRKFLPIAMKVIGLESLPKIIFEKEIYSPEQPTFGQYVNAKHVLYVGLANRHPNDILRTLAHELVHYKQDTEHQLNDLSGETGSPEENQAHAVAGVVMRHFNKQYPEYLKTKPIVAENKDVDEARYAGNLGIMELIKFFQEHPELKPQYDKIKMEHGAIEAMKFALKAINAELEGEPYSVTENFADGRNPQDKGDSARHGIKKGMTIAQLKKIRSSKTASPRKKQLAHWQINMRQGRKK